MNRHVACRTCGVTLVGFGDQDLAELVVWHLRHVHPARVTTLHVVARDVDHPSMLTPEPVA